MTFARPIFSVFAGVLLLVLGIFSITQNPKSQTNRLFSIYTFCNLIWNMTDFIVFVPNLTIGLWLYRFTGFVACFITPTLLHFVYIVGNVTRAKWAKWILGFSYGLGVVMGGLSLTPYVLAGIRYEPFQSVLVEVPGPLYPMFAIFFFSVLFTCFLSASLMIRTRSGIKRDQLIYIMVAMVFGLLGLIFYLWSFSGHDWPWTYYPLQCVSSVIFATAIFKYQLVSVKLVFRRAGLLLGIYTLIGMILTPLIIWFYDFQSQVNPVAIGPVILFAVLAGLIFSLGPLVYSIMVRHYSLFQDTMASQMTHEFKTPLVSIQSARAFLEEALQNPQNSDPAKLKGYLDMIARNSDRLQKVVTDVLDFNRIRDSSIEEEITSINLTELISQIVGDFKNRHARLQFHSNEPIAIKGTEEGIKQIISNLILNAVKFCPQGNIDVRAVKEEGQILISVSDNGSGIAPNNLARVFEPFFKTSSPNQAHGSGLGLSIAKKWVEAHGGKIWAESDGEGKGTTVSFTLPV